jgi:predicted nucleic acid-binding protein
MGLLNIINGESVFIDTAAFIYFVERKPVYVDLLRPVFNAIDAGELRAITTMITYSEVLVVPYRQQNRDLVDKYETLLRETPHLTIAPFNLELAKQTAKIRAQHGIKTPDAIQWATAIRYGVQFFVTNDQGFKRFADPHVILIEEL